MSQARFVGRLLLINIGFYVAAYDTTTIESGRPKQLWRFNITNALGDDVNNVRYRQIKQANGRFRMIPMDQNNRPLCNISLATRDLVCLARGSKLFALDARTGEIVWIRHDVRAGGEIVGDEKTVCLFTEQSNEVYAYSAIDGRELVNFKVPPEGQRIAVQGTKMVTSEGNNAKQTIKIHDLATGKIAWSGDFAFNARASVVDSSYLAVFEQKGTLSVLSLNDGKLLFESMGYLHAEANVSEWQVVRDGDRLLVVVGRGFGNKPNTYVNGINNGSFSSTPFTGYVYAFDIKSGKPLWDRKIEELSLLHNQPQRSPVFVLGSMVVSQENNGNVHRQATRVFAIDKRNGEVVCDERCDNGGGLILHSTDSLIRNASICKPIRNSFN
ncbi:MAG: PQQ-binding-like beta-propeller repeat protein [Pirellulales bacterium]